MLRTCHHCGKDYVLPKCGHRAGQEASKRFCSRYCDGRAHFLASGKSNHGKVFTCRTCGKEWVSDNSKSRLYCSGECYKVEMNRRRSERSKTPEARAKRKEREYVNATCRRARLHNARIERFGRIEIFDRDNWTCGICAGAVSKDLSFPHRESATLDHIVPLSKGGMHERRNVQCTHWICNATKGNRAVGEQLRLVG